MSAESAKISETLQGLADDVNHIATVAVPSLRICLADMERRLVQIETRLRTVRLTNDLNVLDSSDIMT